MSGVSSLLGAVNLVQLITVDLITVIYLLFYLSKNYLCFIDSKKLRFNYSLPKNNLHLRLAKPNIKLNKRYYSTAKPSSSIEDPEFITGFVDAEGSFIIRITKSSKYKIGWRVDARFQIGLNKNDEALLKLIQDEFKGAGVINVAGNVAEFRITAISDLVNILIPHFEKYPLITQKQADYILFKQIVELMKEKKHLTEEGLREIISLRAAMNLGLPTSLQEAFPNITAAIRPIVPSVETVGPNWLVGFSEGESCFFIDINKSSHTKTGFQFQLKFIISQHYRDQGLLNCFINYLGCGKYYLKSGGRTGEFVVGNYLDIVTKIIPFFEKYPFKGTKLYNFLDFIKVANLINNKEHLKPEGVEQIRKIKGGMNRKRVFNESESSFG